MLNYAFGGIAFTHGSNHPSLMGPKPSMALNLLPLWVTSLWLVALAGVLIFHCGHFVRMGGQHRWFHASHILMLVSMLYMYASMEFKWKWFPSSSWVIIFCVSSAAMAGWMILRLVQRRPVSFLWIFALVMQVAMIYMWMPRWAAALTWLLVAYYAVETVAWLAGGLNDSKRTWAASADHAGTTPVAPDSITGPATAATMPSGTAVGLLHDTKRATADLAGARAAVVSLGHESVTARVGMAVMAASMGYMFAAMQLMRSAM